MHLNSTKATQVRARIYNLQGQGGGGRVAASALVIQQSALCLCPVSSALNVRYIHHQENQSRREIFGVPRSPKIP